MAIRRSTHSWEIVVLAVLIMLAATIIASF